MIRIGILVAVATAVMATAEPITYQGQLFMDGLPAAGLFDYEVRLFDAPSLGNQVGQTVLIDDHPVPNGLMDIELDFGDVFDSTDVYIEISIRVGESEDVFDILTPRQHVTTTPKAAHAMTADTIRGGGWNAGGEVVGGGQILWFGDGSDRVLINRTDPVSSAIEYLGVHVENSPIGGIVISNSDPDAVSILSYAPGNTLRASESFNGLTGQWSLEIDQSFILTVDSTGLKAPSYKYSVPATQSVTVAGDVFHSALGTPFRASFFGGGAYLSTPGANDPMVAPISLPHGATITKLVARFEDNAASDIAITLNGATSDGNLIAIASVNTEGIAPFVGIQSLGTTEIDMVGSVVDTSSTGYYIRVFSSSWPGDSSLRIWSVTIEYTVDGPN